MIQGRMIQGELHFLKTENEYIKKLDGLQYFLYTTQKYLNEFFKSFIQWMSSRLVRMGEFLDIVWILMK